MEIIETNLIDPFQFDESSKYFDEKSTAENPRWFMVDIEPVMDIGTVSLHDMKANPNLDGMALLQRGQRLSVQPVSAEHFDEVLSMPGVSRRDIE